LKGSKHEIVIIPVKFAVEMIARFIPPVRKAIMLPNERNPIIGI